MKHPVKMESVQAESQYNLFSMAVDGILNKPGFFFKSLTNTACRSHCLVIMDYSSQNFKKYCSVVDKLQSQKEANLEANSAGIKMSSTFSIAYTSWHKFVHAGWCRSEFWRKGVGVLGWERIETGWIQSRRRWVFWWWHMPHPNSCSWAGQPYTSFPKLCQPTRW